jgi:heme-degrading monooxygenase HmoA
MIARITWGKIKPGKWAEYARFWNEYATAAKGVAGSRGRVLLRDDGDKDSGYSISFWDSAADFEAHERMHEPLHAAMEKLRDCFVGQYVTTVTEVSGSTMEK